MFRKWLSENRVSDFDYSGIIIEKASNREFWEPKSKIEFIENAEQYLGFEWPIIRATDYVAYHTEGNRKKQETPHLKKRTALIALLIGEVLEYKGRFIPDIVDGVFSICEETFWGVAAHYRYGPYPRLPLWDHYIDLFSAETGALIAIALNLLHDELEKYWPDTVLRMKYELEERIIKPYLRHDDFWWMGRSGGPVVNNWNPWILSNILTVFLFAKNNEETLHNGIEKLIYEINSIYQAYRDDGGCDEGVNYWCVSGGTIFEFCEQLYRATNGKINFFADDKIKNIGDYPYKAYIGDNYFVNFADCGCKGSPTWKSIFYCFGKRIGNPNLSKLANDGLGNSNEFSSLLQTTHAKSAIFNVIYCDEFSKLKDFKPCETAILPDIENAFVRVGEWYYAAKGGHNDENHNHNDVGSFIAYYEDQPILIDPGCGPYTKKTFSPQRYEIWTMRSEWHNIPVVNGKQQKAGREYKSDYFGLKDKTCNISFLKAYEEGTNLESLERNISIFDNGLDIIDYYSFNSGGNVIAEHFITPHDVVIEENVVIINEKFKLFADCDVEILVEEQDIVGYMSTWNTTSIKRIVFKVKADKEKTIKFNLRRL